MNEGPAGDEKSMKILQDIANSIYKCVKFTNYIPSKVPVLD